MLYEMMRTMSTRVEKELNTISIQMEKELATEMLINLIDKLELVNPEGILGVITTMTATLPLIRCSEGSPSLAESVDKFTERLIGSVRIRGIIFQDDTYKNREALFNSIPEADEFLKEATKYFGEDYTKKLSLCLGKA